MLGKYMSPKYREQTILLTKTKGTDGETVKRHIRESMDRLRTDYFDFYLLHSINSVEDAESRIERGVYDAILEAKRAGIIRHIGFSGHVTPEANNHIMEMDLPDLEFMPLMWPTPPTRVLSSIPFP